MASLEHKIRWLRDPLGIISFLVWMASFSGYTWSQAHGWQGVTEAFSGYLLGFAAAFAGWIAVQLYKGRWERFVDPHPFWKWFSVVILIGVLVFGVFSEIAGIFGTTTWEFNLLFWVSGLIMAGCLGPLMNKVDGF